MHSGVQTYRTDAGMVIPAYAGIQGIPLAWIPASVSSLVPFPYQVRDKT